MNRSLGYTTEGLPMLSHVFISIFIISRQCHLIKNVSFWPSLFLKLNRAEAHLDTLIGIVL